MTTATTVSIEGQFSIVAQTDRPAVPALVLKQGDSFVVFNPRGDIVGADAPEHGFYHAGTRFLSRFELLLSGHHPLLLSSTIRDDNELFSADLTNPDLFREGQVVVPHGSIHLFRSRVLWADSCIEQIRVSNYLPQRVTLALALRFGADFADIFEVRGTRRARRGKDLGIQIRKAEQLFRYRGLDGLERRTRVRVDATPAAAEGGSITFVLALEPESSEDVEIRVSCESGEEPKKTESYARALGKIRRQTAERLERGCRITSSSEALSRWIRRSTADLHMMQTETTYGLYPYAGIPWFSTPFGRDGLITALQLLWADPDVARGVLSFLAATQATASADAQDAQPGKILHEMRDGEMPALGEVPFGRYYGSADATPLFILLAAAYYERTGDADFIARLWPHIVAAVEWMRVYGDADGDGFIEYARRSGTGLTQQGWKDSYDSVFHADGALADPPIALCEVQAYAYGAWAGAARLAAMRGHAQHAREWHEKATRLRSAFDQAFWCERIGTYALALDRDKRPCQVRASNAGHCLFTGIARPERVAQVSATLMNEGSFAGWGLRTLASGEPRYNPMSYHNGSIWPHDNALVAAGLSRYGRMDAARQILTAMLDLSQKVDLHRLPELICGFHRRADERPTLYPVACAPQAWAAGAVYMFLQACLGLRVDATAGRVTLAGGILPAGVDWLELWDLRIGEATVDLRLERHAYDVGVTVLRRDGAVEIVAIK